MQQCDTDSPPQGCVSAGPELSPPSCLPSLFPPPSCTPTPPNTRPSASPQCDCAASHFLAALSLVAAVMGCRPPALPAPIINKRHLRHLLQPAESSRSDPRAQVRQGRNHRGSRGGGRSARLCAISCFALRVIFLRGTSLSELIWNGAGGTEGGRRAAARRRPSGKHCPNGGRCTQASRPAYIRFGGRTRTRTAGRCCWGRWDGNICVGPEASSEVLRAAGEYSPKTRQLSARATRREVAGGRCMTDEDCFPGPLNIGLQSCTSMGHPICSFVVIDQSAQRPLNNDGREDETRKELYCDREVTLHTQSKQTRMAA
jgi:hypothetical protein